MKWLVPRVISVISCNQNICIFPYVALFPICYVSFNSMWKWLFHCLLTIWAPKALILCLPYCTVRRFTLCNFPLSPTTSALKIIILHTVFPPLCFTECCDPSNRILGHSLCLCMFVPLNFYLCYRGNSYQIFDQCWLSALNVCVCPRILYWKLNPQCDCIRAHGLAGNWVLRWFSSAVLWMRLVFIYMGSKRVLTFSLPSENAMRCQ